MNTAISSVSAIWRFRLGRCSCNVGRALDAAGARPDDVTKITIFVVGYRREQLSAIEQGRVALFGDHKPADTIVGVEALARPEYLIEVEATAVIDSRDRRAT